MATTARNGPALDHDVDHWSKQAISVISHRGRLCGRVPCELRYCCTAGDLLSYWQDRYQWNNSLVRLVDLLGTKKALSKLSHNSLRRIQKLRCGWLPVNTRVSREDPDRLSGCSACSPGTLVDETVDHVFQCSCTARRSAILQRFSLMSAKFREWKRSTNLIYALHSGALAWIEQREPPPVASLRLPETHLGLAILTDHLPVVKALVSGGADILATNNNGQLPIHQAVRRQHSEVSKYLLRKIYATIRHLPLHKMLKNLTWTSFFCFVYVPMFNVDQFQTEKVIATDNFT
jgi:hypothetical protein